MLFTLQVHLDVAIVLRLGHRVRDRSAHVRADLPRRRVLVACRRRIIVFLPLDARIILARLVLIQEVLRLVLEQS